MLNHSLDAATCNPRIPTIPSIARDAMRVLRMPEPDLQALSDVVRLDQAIALKIIRIINSKSFGTPGSCASIDEAVEMLGPVAVKGLVLGFTLSEKPDGGSGDDSEVGFDYIEYWRRGMRCARAALELADASGTCNPDEAFLAALIQDVGMTALHRAHGDLYLQAIDITRDEHPRLAEIERRSFATDHPQVGAALAERWRFPSRLIEAVRFHHDADHAPTDALDLARCVDLAGQVCACDADAGASIQIRRLASQWMGLDGKAFDAVLHRIRRETDDVTRRLAADVCEAIDCADLLMDAEDARIEHEMEMLRLAGEAMDAAQQIGGPLHGPLHRRRKAAA